MAETLFGGCHVDGFFLEYDSERAGGVEPLRFIQNQQVVLGLVTSKAPELENEEDVIARIREAPPHPPHRRARLGRRLNLKIFHASLIFSPYLQLGHGF